MNSESKLSEVRQLDAKISEVCPIFGAALGIGKEYVQVHFEESASEEQRAKAREIVSEFLKEKGITD